MKLNWKRILLDPALWVLLITNVCLVRSYMQQPEIFTTLIWLYWAQSVLYGIFVYYDIRTTKNMVASNREELVAGTTNAAAANWGYSRIFAFFHLVYIVFLLTIKKTGEFQWVFFWQFLAVFFVLQVIIFIQHKVQNKVQPVDVEKMAGMQFVRVIPMHLCIMIPAFLDISHLTVFLVMKVITDVVTFVYTTTYYRRGHLMADATVMNVNSTISS